MNVADALAEHADGRPDAPALITPEATVGFGELDRAIAWTAKRMADAGIAPGDVVGIDVENQIGHLTSVLALIRLGACQFSFQPPDPLEQKQALAKRIGMTALISRSDERTFGARHVPPPPFGRAGDLKDAPAVEFPGRQSAADPCMIVRTSGTTGAPKLAAVTFAQSWARTEPTPADGPDCRHLTGSHLAFLGARENLLRCLAAGGAFVQIDARSSRQVVDVLRRFRVTYYSGTPQHAGLMLRRAPKQGHLLPDIQLLRIGAAPTPEPLRNEIRAHISPNLACTYGTTETGLAALMPPTSPEATIPGVVGYPMSSIDVAITDDDGRPLGPGEVGLLRLRSPRNVSGYLDDPDATAKSFRDGWFLTHDRAELTPGGAIVFHGRDDEMMIFDGINILPAEIENVLLDHPAVTEAAAFSLPSVHRGDVPWAAVVLNTPTRRTELLNHVKSHFGIQRLESLISVPRLPRNDAGKIDVSKLREIAERKRRERQSKRNRKA